MEEIRRIEADSLIFDLDGTLWNFSSGAAAAWNRILRQHSLEHITLTGAQIAAVSGLPVDEVLQSLLPGIPLERAIQLDEQACLLMDELLRESEVSFLYDQVPETLDQLRKDGIKLFLISNCEKEYLDSFLDTYHMRDVLDDWSCFGGTGLSKAENIRNMVEKHRLSDPIYVGDTAGDQKASQLAGVRFLYACYGFGVAENPAYKLESVEQLPLLIEKTKHSIAQET